jgi:Tol biopolymer transport system component/DNA-binding winged helix-turn-helix (wHTH) protein
MFGGGMDKSLKQFYEFGGFRLDGSECLLLRDGEVVSLTPKAFDLLKVMVERPGQLLTKEELLQAVWPGTFVEGNNLADNISKLRKVLGDGDNGKRFIETVPKRGYRFSAPVEVVRASTGKGGARELPDEPSPRPDQQDTWELPSPITIVRWWRVAILGLATTLLISALLMGSCYGVRSWIRDRFQPHPPTLRPFTQFTFGGGSEGLPTWSPDGRMIAYCSDRGGNFDIWVQEVSGGDPVQVTKSEAFDGYPDWSPDGTKIVFRSERDGGGLYVVPALGGLEQKISSFGFDPHWSGDGTRILFNDNRAGTGVGQPYIIGLDGAPPVRVQPQFLSEFILFGIKWVGWHADGQRISVWGEHSKLGRGFWTMPASGGKPVKSEIPAEIESQIKSANVSLEGFVWAPSGKYLYFGGSDFNVRSIGGSDFDVHSIWRVGVDPSTLRWVTALERLTNDSGRCNDLALSPDGKKLAYQICNATTRIWSAPFDSARGQLKGAMEPITAAGKWSWAFDLSPDGKMLSFAVHRAGKWERWEKSLEDGTEKLLATQDRGYVAGFWSRDGSRLVAQKARGPKGSELLEDTIIVYPAGGGDEQIVASPTMRNFGGWDWTSDGQWVLAWDCPRSPVSAPSYIKLLPLAAAPHAETAARTVTSSGEYDMWQPRLSPDDRWVSFNATKKVGWENRKSVVYIVPISGGKWIRITEGKYWDDVPRWSADGETIYFTSDRSGSANIWGIRFNPVIGEPIGDPFQVTFFYENCRMNARGIAYTIGANRLIVNLQEFSGDIWILENVDR